jgi:hypothetical protein
VPGRAGRAFALSRDEFAMRVITVSESERRTGRLLAYVAGALFFSLVCLHALAA